MSYITHFANGVSVEPCFLYRPNSARQDAENLIIAYIQLWYVLRRLLVSLCSTIAGKLQVVRVRVTENGFSLTLFLHHVLFGQLAGREAAAIAVLFLLS